MLGRAALSDRYLCSLANLGDRKASATCPATPSFSVGGFNFSIVLIRMRNGVSAASAIDHSPMA